MPDMTLLILEDHEALHRMFADLKDMRDDSKRASELWADLAALLEVHASAEEEHFYPALLLHVPGSEDETRDAIGDHDEIRDGIRHAAAAEVGSEQWWKGVEEARDANDEHLAEEERDDLPDCLRYFSLELRTELGARFQEFKDKHPHARGLSGADKDPDSYRGAPARLMRDRCDMAAIPSSDATVSGGRRTTCRCGGAAQLAEPTSTPASSRCPVADRAGMPPERGNLTGLSGCSLHHTGAGPYLVSVALMSLVRSMLGGRTDSSGFLPAEWMRRVPGCGSLCTTPFECHYRV